MSKNDEAISLKTLKIIVKCYNLTKKEEKLLFSFHNLKFKLERTTDLQKIDLLRPVLFDLQTEITLLLVEKKLNFLLKEFFHTEK